MNLFRIRDLTLRLFLYCMYSEGDHPYIRRDRHLFSINVRPLLRIMSLKRMDVIRAFRGMEKYGLIYNLDTVGADIKFALNPPAWLTFSEKESILRTGKIGNIALVLEDSTGEKASEWNKR